MSTPEASSKRAGGGAHPAGRRSQRRREVREPDPRRSGRRRVRLPRWPRPRCHRLHLPERAAGGALGPGVAGAGDDERPASSSRSTTARRSSCAWLAWPDGTSELEAVGSRRRRPGATGRRPCPPSGASPAAARGAGGRRPAATPDARPAGRDPLCWRRSPSARYDRTWTAEGQQRRCWRPSGSRRAAGRSRSVAHPGWLDPGRQRRPVPQRAAEAVDPRVQRHHSSRDRRLRASSSRPVGPSTRVFERKGHDFVELDVVVAAEGAPVWSVRHVAIYRPRPVSSGTDARPPPETSLRGLHSPRDGA